MSSGGAGWAHITGLGPPGLLGPQGYYQIVKLSQTGPFGISSRAEGYRNERAISFPHPRRNRYREPGPAARRPLVSAGVPARWHPSDRCY